MKKKSFLKQFKIFPAFLALFLLLIFIIFYFLLKNVHELSFKSFDGNGNYSFGVKEQIIFTEIDYDKIDSIRGMDISLTTTAKTDE